jgi:DNA-binding MarR family transcriptional regulator
MPKALTKSNRARNPSTIHLSVSRTDPVAQASEPELRHLTNCLHSLSSRYHDLIQGYATHIGISGMPYTILTTIRHLEPGGDVFPVTIAEYLSLTSAGVAKIIQHLTELGLVQKAGDSDDRRRTRLTVTQHGRSLLDSLAPMQSKINDVWLSCMDATEFSVFVGLVERFIKSSDRALALQNYLVKNDDIA